MSASVQIRGVHLVIETACKPEAMAALVRELGELVDRDELEVETVSVGPGATAEVRLALIDPGTEATAADWINPKLAAVWNAVDRAEQSVSADCGVSPDKGEV